MRRLLGSARPYQLRPTTLKGRGTIIVGSYADILLIDWKNLRMNSTPKETRRYPTGFEMSSSTESQS